jgi:cation transport regulator ChaB
LSDFLDLPLTSSSIVEKKFQKTYDLFMVWTIKSKIITMKKTIMKKQTAIEKKAFNCALQIYKLIDSFPEDKKSVGHEMASIAVKMSAGISTFINLNELNAAYNFLNDAFSATYRIEVYLFVSMDLHWTESIDGPMKSLENLRKDLDKMLNRDPEMDEGEVGSA